MPDKKNNLKNTLIASQSDLTYDLQKNKVDIKLISKYTNLSTQEIKELQEREK